MSLNLLVAEARLPLTSQNFLKMLSLPFDQDKDFPCKALSDLIDSRGGTIS